MAAITQGKGEQVRKPKFNWEFNLGHLGMVISVIAAGYAQWHGVQSDLAEIKRDVERHDAMIQKITDAQALAIQTQAVLAQRFADHLENTRERTRSPKDISTN